MRKGLLSLISLGIFLALIQQGTAATHKHKKTHNKPSATSEKGIKKEPKEAPKEAESPLSGSFLAASNYIFRGIGQTNNLPAFQGGLTYTFLKPGIYFSFYGSNVDFPDANNQTVTVEVDGIAGFKKSIGDNFSFDMSFVRYYYPKSAGVTYNEYILNLSYYFLTSVIGYSNNAFDLGKSGTYYNIGFKYDIPPKYVFCLSDLNISGGIGHYSLARSVGLRSYDDYNVQLTKTIGSYVLALQWTSTNMRSIDPTSLKDSHLTALLTVNF